MDRHRPVARTGVRNVVGDHSHGGSSEGRERPERSPPAGELPGEGAGRNTDDIT
jgi:hypothetical protein